MKTLFRPSSGGDPSIRRKEEKVYVYVDYEQYTSSSNG
jgi:hypothetical protein